MTIHILLFAVLRDAAGAGEVTLELPQGSTARDAGAALSARFPALEPYLSRVAFAVNRSYAPPETALREGDEMALIPPVSGG